MILVLGGTTEGRSCVQVLDEAGRPFFYATRFGDQQVESKNGIRVDGGMDAVQMQMFIHEHGVSLLIDAAHPFAMQLHRNAVEAASATGIPVCRYERCFPAKDPRLIYCSSYHEAVKRLRQDRVGKLLALTGVQTIAKLREYWSDHPLTFFRILDRDSSRQLAKSQGFPMERICYFEGGAEAEYHLLEKQRPEAILTKESGESGFFAEKVDAALSLGIRVYVDCRPKLPDGYVRVFEGPVGLRLAVDSFLPMFFDQRIGLTTGTSATAAAKAALLFRLRGRVERDVLVALPKTGERVPLSVTRIESDGAHVRATVCKDGGDDPDSTHGTPVVADVYLPVEQDSHQPFVRIDGGEGIGRISLPGFDLPIGSAAINVVPRQMITKEIEQLLPGRPVEVTISVPHGRSIGPRTFNPRLGITGGISIIGTTGVVRPFSNEAFVASIERSVDVALAVGGDTVVINSGGKSEHKLKALYPDLPPHCFVQYGNFIGETLQMLNKRRVPKIVMGIMIGKAVKLAEGKLDTHSHKVVMNKKFLLRMAVDAGCSTETMDRIKGMNMARQILSDLSEDDRDRMLTAVEYHCYRVCKPLVPHAELSIRLVKD